MPARMSLMAAIVLFALALGTAETASAQTQNSTDSRRIVTTTDLQAALARQAQSDAQVRTDVRAVLQHPKAQEVAKRLGVDLKRADQAVASLSTEELASLAEPARSVNATLAGGQGALIISTTTLLLIIIIIILIAD